MEAATILEQRTDRKPDLGPALTDLLQAVGAACGTLEALEERVNGPDTAIDQLHELRPALLRAWYRATIASGEAPGAIDLSAGERRILGLPVEPVG